MCENSWKKVFVVVAALLACAGMAQADTFGTGGNVFDIDFVTISGATNPASGYGIVNNDFRIGVYEVTNDQWVKFQASLGVSVTGVPSNAYDSAPYWTSNDVPTNNVSWYEAAQFVNWLNASQGYQGAYRFVGTGSNATFVPFTADSGDRYDPSNPYRNRNAMYFLPTEDEWVKAGYWNGTTLQTYATKAGESVYQGDGLSGTGWNYYANRYATDPYGPWDVGSGSEELNGTFDLMGNVFEWLESPYSDNDYGTYSIRGMRGGSFQGDANHISAWYRQDYKDPSYEAHHYGFRVASEVPEPCSLGLLSLGGLALIKRRRTS